ncbi:hypothetical protein [Pandoraea sputorum]|uniref:hypothetical protein n=1 Tax=Pandoraea sputorum TaxID=93222 RepID=UPI0012415EBD|nr:hypothetical protein [Pandoraea sputorum]VVE82626.1 hypothetical protein PSP31120_03692 [Pandoraea sputorum]
MKIPLMKPNGAIVMVREKLAGVLVKRGRFSFVDGAAVSGHEAQPQEKASGVSKGAAKAVNRTTNSKKGS